MALYGEHSKPVRREPPTQSRMIEAARIKASVPIALGDCFAIATAVAHALPLLTGNPEILDRDDLSCRVVDLRAPS